MVSTTNLVAYYKLDDNAANTSVDDAHSTNDGTASTNTENLYIAGGKINSAFDFTASSSEKVTLPDLNLTSAMSISVWVKIESLSSEVSIFGQSNAAGTGTNYYLGVLSDGRLYWKIEQNSPTYKEDYVLSTNTISTGTWYHILAVYNSSTMEAWVNGVSWGTDTSQDLMDTNTGDYYLAWGGPDRDHYMDGIIDEVGFWNVALTSSDATDLYNSGSGLAYPFSSGTTISASALTLSTTAQTPVVQSGTSTTWIATNIGLGIYLKSLKRAGGEINYGTFEVGTGTKGTRFINKNYPITEGLEAGTTKQTGKQINLTPKGFNNKKSMVLKRSRKGV